MIGFLAGFSSSESILADQNDLFPVLASDSEKREICRIFARLLNISSAFYTIFPKLYN